MFIEALIALFHILILVYWLGGDLGAFYTSQFLTKPNVSNDRRLLALKIVNDVDMAPRTGLILALPTGLLLAQTKSWITLPPIVLSIIILLSIVWLAIAWKLHLDHHKPTNSFKFIDSIFRYGTLIILLVCGVLGLTGKLDLPAFISAKMLVLAACISLGLYIRVVLKPLGPAIGELTGPETVNAQTQIAKTLNRARPLVVGIWISLILAAILGLWTPISF